MFILLVDINNSCLIVSDKKGEMLQELVMVGCVLLTVGKQNAIECSATCAHTVHCTRLLRYAFVPTALFINVTPGVVNYD